MSDHERFLDLCAAFTAGALTPEERRELDEHLATGCAECEQALAAFHEGGAALALSAAPAVPPAALKRRVLAAIEVKGAGGQRGRVLAIAGWAVAAVLAIVAYLGWNRTATYFDGPPPVWSLKPASADFEGLLGWVVYFRATGRAGFTLENYRPPEGKDYELWAIRGGKPVSLGVVRTDAEGKASVVFEKLLAIEALAVSLEPSGGSKTGAPTTVVSVAALAG